MTRSKRRTQDLDVVDMPPTMTAGGPKGSGDDAPPLRAPDRVGADVHHFGYRADGVHDSSVTSLFERFQEIFETGGEKEGVKRGSADEAGFVPGYKTRTSSASPSPCWSRSSTADSSVGRCCHRAGDTMLAVGQKH